MFDCIIGVFEEGKYKEKSLRDPANFEQMFEVRRVQDIGISEREIQRCIQFYKWVGEEYAKLVNLKNPSEQTDFETMYNQISGIFEEGKYKEKRLTALTNFEQMFEVRRVQDIGLSEREIRQ